MFFVEWAGSSGDRKHCCTAVEFEFHFSFSVVNRSPVLTIRTASRTNFKSHNSLSERRSVSISRSRGIIDIRLSDRTFPEMLQTRSASAQERRKKVAIDLIVLECVQFAMFYWTFAHAIHFGVLSSEDSISFVIRSYIIIFFSFEVILLNYTLWIFTVGSFESEFWMI